MRQPVTSPCFSVVVPCFNRLDLLRKTLRSLTRQSMSDFEVILVDDCSPLSMDEVFGEFSATLGARGQRARLIRLEKNQGPARARNVGWNEAVGRYIAFLDSDDIWHPEKLAICQTILGSSDAKALYHSFSYSDPADAPTGLNASGFTCKYTGVWRGLIRNYSATPCFIIARDIDERFDETMRYVEDHDLWLRIARRYPLLELQGPALTFLGRPIMSSGGLSSHRWKMRLSECRMYWKYCRTSPLVVAFPVFVTWAVLKHLKALWGPRRLRAG